MDLVKLLVIFGIMIAIIWMKKPLSVAVAAATVGTILLYRLSAAATAQAVLAGALGRGTLETLLVFYVVTFLQRMLEKRENLRDSRTALNGIFNNNRVNASVAPFLLGMLPAASAVLICGPIVRDSVGDALDRPEQASLTSYFRHVSESFLPTHAGVFIALSLSGGKVAASSFILAMLPMVAAQFLAGRLVYLRRIPKDTGMVPDRPKRYYVGFLVRSIWSIVLAILLVLAFRLPVAAAVLVCVVLNFFVNRFSFREILPLFRTAFETRLMVSTWLVMIFKEVLAATGVIRALPAFFEGLPIPGFLTFALIFFFGTVVAGSQAINVLCIPMAMAAVGDGPGLALFVLVMCMSYVAMQISPVHICLTLCAEDFRVSLGSMVRKTLPLVAIFSVIAFAYYAILSAVGL